MNTTDTDASILHKVNDTISPICKACRAAHIEGDKVLIASQPTCTAAPVHTMC